MMVKDEEKNMKRCLDAFTPLLKKSDVELIIVDTGSRDKTVEIAAGYTEKIYYHAWNNNFSEIRNILIAYAKGKFILVVDADEVLQDADKLYDILSDENSNKFNVFIMKVKNFTGSSGMFTVLPQERVFKNDGYFRFDGSIHNQPVYKDPVANINIYIDHYGYMYEDNEALREKKFIRTGGILRSCIEKEPNNAYYRFQMAKSYSAHKDIKEAMDEIRIAYKLIAGDKEQIRQHIYICGTYAILSCSSKYYDEAVNVCQAGISVRQDYLDLYYILGEALIGLNRKQEAIQAYLKYAELSLKYNELSVSSDRGVEICYMGDIYLDRALNISVNELVLSGRYEDALYYSSLITDVKVRLVWQIRIYIHKNKFEEAAGIYYQNTADNGIVNLLSCTLEELKENMSGDQKYTLTQLLSAGSDIYSRLNQCRLAGREERSGLVSRFIKEVNVEDLPRFYSDLFSDIRGNIRSAIYVFKRLSKSKIKDYMKDILDSNSETARFLEEYLVNEDVRNGDFQSLRIFVSISYALLLHEALRIRDGGLDVSEKYYSVFKLYVERGVKYASMLYNPERLRLFYGTLEDNEDRFFISLDYALEAIGSGEHGAAVRYFMDAARSNPYLACYMKKYKDELFHGDTAEGDDLISEQH